MKEFLDQNFLLQTNTACELYHLYARDLPIIDYHCHLSPQQISEDHQFENLTQIWLNGDHYKWRAMRANGVDESYITGNRSDYEKFEKWAFTVPYTLRNPLFHWTHLELQRYFDIHELLNPSSAKKIYKECSEKLQTKEYSVRNLLRKMKVQLVCTTDDPVDDLTYHKALSTEKSDIRMFPAFRPDAVLKIEDPAAFKSYIKKLVQVSGIQITTYDNFLSALRQRHDYFSGVGCTISDHGLEHMYAENYTPGEINNIFNNVITGIVPSQSESFKFKTAVLKVLAQWNHEKGWVQQYHLGAIRNNRSGKGNEKNPDAGYDSIGDFPQAQSLSKFLNDLDKSGQLAKTIAYNLNPADNELVATMTGNFNEGSVVGKMQYGAAWWYLDQKNGIEDQLNTLSNMGLLSRFVGMLTDSRSFLSYPRHEYFRRILCNVLGKEMEEGELPYDMNWIGGVVRDVCYYNAINYFDFKIAK